MDFDVVPMIFEHKGIRQYVLWFVDIDGHEDFLTISMTFEEANRLHNELTEYKIQNEISDFVLHFDEPFTYDDAFEYITDSLS
jgi:hypothetical protein